MMNTINKFILNFLFHFLFRSDPSKEKERDAVCNETRNIFVFRPQEEQQRQEIAEHLYNKYRRKKEKKKIKKEEEGKALDSSHEQNFHAAVDYSLSLL